MKVLCFSASDRQDVYGLFHKSFVEYCERWNIAYKMFPITHLTTRAASWTKIQLLINLIGHDDYKEYDYFWWVDDDMVLTNKNESIIDIISNLPRAPIVVQRDIAGDGCDVVEYDKCLMNCGTMVIQNSYLARDVLTKIWHSASSSEMTQPNWEQDTMIRMYRDDSTVRDCIALVDWKTLQSFHRLRHYTPVGLTWVPGDFIAHLTGNSTEERMAMFRHLDV